MRNLISNSFLYLVPIAFVGVLWQVSANMSAQIKFLFASPLLIISKLYEKISNGELIIHTSVTALEAIVGFISGVLIGSILGFTLIYTPKIAKFSKPYVVALGAIPIFAIAPMMIIWFGTDIFMKIAMAFFSTVFVATSQAYQGGQSISIEEENYFILNGATSRQKFWNLTFPASISWLFQSLKLNIGLAILGAFIGEFIASDKGLGYIIIKASGLYDVPYVLAAVMCIILLSISLNSLVGIIEKYKIFIIRKFVVQNLPIK